MVYAEKNVILEAEKNMSDQNRDYSVKLYGTGEAGNKIIETLIEHDR